MWSAVTPPLLNQTQRAVSALYKRGQYLSSLSALLLLQHNPHLKRALFRSSLSLSPSLLLVLLFPCWRVRPFTCTHWFMINKVSLLCLSGHEVRILEEEEENVGANWKVHQAAGWTGTKPHITWLSLHPNAPNCLGNNLKSKRLSWSSLTGWSNFCGLCTGTWTACLICSPWPSSCIAANPVWHNPSSAGTQPLRLSVLGLNVLKGLCECGDQCPAVSCTAAGRTDNPVIPGGEHAYDSHLLPITFSCVCVNALCHSDPCQGLQPSLRQVRQQNS